MQHSFRLGERIYYVPQYDTRLARYVPITRLRLSLTPPIIILGHHLVLSPRPSKDGNIARDYVGSFWISKEAYEAYRIGRQQSLWHRISKLMISFQLKILLNSGLPGSKFYASKNPIVDR